MATAMFRAQPKMMPGSRRMTRPGCTPAVSFAQGFRRPRIIFARPPRAFYNSQGWDEAAMKECYERMAKQYQSMAKQWKENGSMGGAFFWPGGGYVYGAGQRCRTNKPNNDATSPFNESGAFSSPQLRLDVVENEQFYLLFADVPGLSKTDLKIKLSKDNILTISGDRKQPVEEGYKQKERRFGTFERKWSLPEDADSEGISAKVTEGVLTITLPKKQPEPVVDDSQDIFIN